MTVNLNEFFDQLQAFKDSMGPVLSEILFLVVTIVLSFCAKKGNSVLPLPISMVIGVVALYLVRFIVAPLIAQANVMPGFAAFVGYFVPLLLTPFFVVGYILRRLSGR